ncbi:hypothetical protein C8C87_2625 [Flavobacterium sp. 120]|nr:hypothetical protein CLV00_1370 [Flavobacterium sp. 11]RKS15288.1 hypothetical protein C8C87_2625 [Flavobacterium sp. 120]
MNEQVYFYEKNAIQEYARICFNANYFSFSSKFTIQLIPNLSANIPK